MSFHLTLTPNLLHFKLFSDSLIYFAYFFSFLYFVSFYRRKKEKGI